MATILKTPADEGAIRTTSNTLPHHPQVGWSVLLAAILLAARRILAAAVRCLNAVEAIRGNTQPLHELTTTNAVAADLLGGAGAIKRHAEVIASALEATESPSPAQPREAQRHE